MEVADWLRDVTQRLSEAGIASARLDCLILLEDATGKDRAWLLAHPEYELDDATTAQLDLKIGRRLKHEPLAYIRQRTEFYGRTFTVNAQVLEPRPETETMIEILKGLSLPERPVIADIGTGSGAIAVTTKLELPQARVYATDIDPACLAVARRNADTLQADIELFEADLLRSAETSLGTPDVILANLPYVPDDWHINQAAMSEPRIAIFGGPDGMHLYRRMFTQIGAMDHKPAFVLTESLPPHHEALKRIAHEHGYEQYGEQDFIQIFRTSP